VRRAALIPPVEPQHRNSLDFAGYLDLCPGARSVTAAATRRWRNAVRGTGGGSGVRKASIADRAQAGRGAVPIFSPGGSFSQTNNVELARAHFEIVGGPAQNRFHLPPRRAHPSSVSRPGLGPPRRVFGASTGRGGNHAAGAGTGLDGQALCVTDDLRADGADGAVELGRGWLVGWLDDHDHAHGVR
jgi:hypothetical protein